MREDHDQAWLQDHILPHMLILAGHHHHRLLARDTLGNVVLIVAPVHLPCLERGQSLRPVTLVGVLDQVVHDRQGAAAVDEGALDDRLEDGVGSGDHASPACDSGRLHGVHPPGDKRKLHTETQPTKTMLEAGMKFHLLQDLVVFDALFEVLQIGVSTADCSHVGF